jgi:hypothetical protein
MKKLYFADDKEKEIIRNLHESIKKSTLITEANGQTKEEYPICVQTLGSPTTPNGTIYGIMSTVGEFSGYSFYTNYRVMTPKGMNDYYCSGNKVVIGKKPASTPKAPNPKITELQKSLNTKLNLGLKEDGVLGQKTVNAIYTALTGASTTLPTENK